MSKFQSVPQTHRPNGSLWSIAEAAAFLDISPRHLFRLLSSGKVQSVTIGRRRLIPSSEVERLAADGC